MLRALAVADSVGFVVRFFASAFSSVVFLEVSVISLMSSSRVSGFLMSVPDILVTEKSVWGL